MIKSFFYERFNKNMHIVGFVLVAVLMFLPAFMLMGCGSAAGTIFSGKKKVGKDVSEVKFKEFYYTYSTTTNPPKFQRYRFYMEDGKPMFYHEKREGNKVFLTEEDITVYGTKELSNEEWETFWDYMTNGTVKNRVEGNTTGDSGPWLYLYWDGDKGKCQQYSFNEDGMVLDFEEFCESLKEEQLRESGENSDWNAEGTGEEDSQNIDFPVRKYQVHVSNTLEFLNAIADNTEIVMNEGVYNFTKDIQIEGEEQFINWEKEHDNVLLSMNLSDGFAAEVYEIDGLSIVAAPGASVSIVTEPRNVNVLMFSSCGDIFMSGITMGHTPDKGSCEGGVLKFEYCENISLNKMDLYGCGTYGIVYEDISSLELSDSTIRDCSEGIIDGSNGRDLSFLSCEMVDCSGFVMIRANTTDALFEDCCFSRNTIKRDFLPADNMENNIEFNKCTFGADEAQSIKILDYIDNGCIQFIDCIFEE